MLGFTDESVFVDCDRQRKSPAGSALLAHFKTAESETTETHNDSKDVRHAVSAIQPSASEPKADEP